jgi:hypothetical protein
VRKAFTADVSAGKTLIVADYGQLELRLLAHMADCKSMLRAFELGGDFHSRWARGAVDCSGPGGGMKPCTTKRLESRRTRAPQKARCATTS